MRPPSRARPSMSSDQKSARRRRRSSPRSLEFADVRAQILLVLLALAVTPACVGNKAYRTQTPVLHETLQTRQFDPTQDDDAEWPFTMAFIEFDDRGEMFSRTQLERATAEIA